MYRFPQEITAYSLLYRVPRGDTHVTPLVGPMEKLVSIRALGGRKRTCKVTGPLDGSSSRWFLTSMTCSKTCGAIAFGDYAPQVFEQVIEVRNHHSDDPSVGPVTLHVRLRPPLARIETCFSIGSTRGVTYSIVPGTRYRARILFPGEGYIWRAGKIYRVNTDFSEQVFDSDTRVYILMGHRHRFYVTSQPNVTPLRWDLY